VIGEKGGRAAASGAKFCTWLDEKLPAERETLRRAIAPVASCIAAAAGGDAAQLTTDIVSRTHKKLRDELNAIATGKTEAELKPAITEYFQNWSNEPCPDSAKAAA
jgi:hypothetical protein